MKKKKEKRNGQNYYERREQVDHVFFRFHHGACTGKLG